MLSIKSRGVISIIWNYIVEGKQCRSNQLALYEVI